MWANYIDTDVNLLLNPGHYCKYKRINAHTNILLLKTNLLLTSASAAAAAALALQLCKSPGLPLLLTYKSIIAQVNLLFAKRIYYYTY
jgi:hypothetical protein